MKPAPFAYHAPTTIDEATSLLAEHGDEARVLAGGQSLLALMNYRRVKPVRLVDITRIEDLDYVRRENGHLAVGAGARQSAFEGSPESAESAPLVVEAVRYVAHPSVRNLGTVVGSVAHSDPAAEIPACALALDAEIILSGPDGERAVAATEFFTGPHTNAREEGEMLTEVRLPAWPEGSGHAFVEFQRKHGSYALVACAVMVHMDGESIDCASIAMAGIGETPLRITTAEEMLTGNAPSTELFAEAAEEAARGLSPMPDVKGSPEYRKKLAKVYVRRGLELAVRRAKGEET